MRWPHLIVGAWLAFGSTPSPAAAGHAPSQHLRRRRTLSLCSPQPGSPAPMLPLPLFAQSRSTRLVFLLLFCANIYPSYATRPQKNGVCVCQLCLSPSGKKTATIDRGRRVFVCVCVRLCKETDARASVYMFACERCQRYAEKNRMCNDATSASAAQKEQKNPQKTTSLTVYCSTSERPLSHPTARPEPHCPSFALRGRRAAAPRTDRARAKMRMKPRALAIIFSSRVLSLASPAMSDMWAPRAVAPKGAGARRGWRPKARAGGGATPQLTTTGGNKGIAPLGRLRSFNTRVDDHCRQLSFSQSAQRHTRARALSSISTQLNSITSLCAGPMSSALVAPPCFFSAGGTIAARPIGSRGRSGARHHPLARPPGCFRWCATTFSWSAES